MSGSPSIPARAPGDGDIGERRCHKPAIAAGSALLCVALLIAAWHTAGAAWSASCPPPVIIWAWERPDDLSGLDPQVAGVAYLAKTLVLRNDTIEVRQRRQPLALSRGIWLAPVVRIEVARKSSPALSAEQSERVAREVLALVRPGTPAVQIDFDAARSQRAFYSGVLTVVRARLPSGTRLSITALASWALFDTWIDALPIDEAVPMLFRMGADTADVRRRLGDSGAFRAVLARSALGISTDETFAPLPAGRRVYLFSPKTWTPAATAAAIREVTSWQGTVSCSPS
ncbi:MAG: hypothetical protein IPK66_07145 [Rhodospirillales bacterium]|nr:hypothetical protein [Rhodospirillales bacterium]